MKASAEQCDRSKIKGSDYCEQQLSKKEEERTTEESRERETNNLGLIPDHNAETAFAEWLFTPLEERRVVEWPLAALHDKKV